MALTAGLAAAFALLLLLSAGLTAALSAVTRIGRSRARILADEGFAGADALLALRSDESGTAALGLLRAFCSLGAAVAGVALATVVWGSTGMWVGIPVVVVAVVLAGDIGPRALAGGRPVRLALAAAPALARAAAVCGRVFMPLLAVGRLAARTTQRGAEPGDGGASAGERQVREALEIGADEGVVEADESRLVERAFALDELNAWDAMTPRVDIVAWKDSRLLGEAMAELEEVPHSRVPVYGDSIDDVTGILHVRDAYRAYVAGRRNAPLGELAREAMFVPGSLSLARLLADFKARRTHMGIVADEFGGTDGLITLEDVLEELVGDIADETDVDEDPVTQVSENEIVAAGGADLREINERFGFGLQPGEHRSVNGFILEELGRVPEAGRVLDADGVRIEVLEATDTQVLRARLSRDPAKAPGR